MSGVKGSQIVVRVENNMRLMAIVRATGKTSSQLFNEFVADFPLYTKDHRACSQSQPQSSPSEQQSALPLGPVSLTPPE